MPVASFVPENIHVYLYLWGAGGGLQIFFYITYIYVYLLKYFNMKAVIFELPDILIQFF